jgi:hypothetical protein
MLHLLMHFAEALKVLEIRNYPLDAAVVKDLVMLNERIEEIDFLGCTGVEEAGTLHYCTQMH